MVRETKPRTPVRTDDEIRRHVLEQLNWDDRVDSENITVDVRQGQVTLTGTVPTYGALRAASQSAKSVLGVRDVHCRLSVLLPNHTRTPEDTEIRLSAINTLTWSPEIDPSDVEVFVEDGVVVLEGSVESAAQKHRAEDLVASLDGVRSVKNHLHVMRTGDMLDSAIADDVVAALKRDPSVDAGNITVDVRDGIVGLTGSVPTAQAGRTAQHIAASVPGVLEVTNQLTVGS